MYFLKCIFLSAANKKDPIELGTAHNNHLMILGFCNAFSCDLNSLMNITDKIIKTEWGLRDANDQHEMVNNGDDKDGSRLISTMHIKLQ